ncbi:MAG: GAF domain-containing protein [Caulobacter sp.]|nr:GAF domain-containing protein [Caulobacter sp.]
MLNAANAEYASGADHAALVTLVETIEALAGVKTIEEVAAVVRSAARRISGADGVCFVLRDGDLCWYLDEDAIGPMWKGQRFPMTACISGWAMLNRQTVVIPDIYRDDRIPHDAYRPTFVQSLVMTPVRPNDPIAALGAYWAKRHVPPPDIVTKLEVVARATAAAIENAHLYRSLNEALERRSFLLRELDHRVKNTLASVQSIARQTLRNAQTPGDFADSFESRLMSLSRAHEMLTRRAWGRTDLLEVMETALQPFGGVMDPRFTVRGPAVTVTAETAVALHMTVHELMVNAAKYGALTSANGQVTVVWRIEPVEGRASLVLEWVERGGPPVFAPTREGFGTRLLRHGLARDLGGAATLGFQPAGLTYHFCAPLSDRITPQNIRSVAAS